MKYDDLIENAGYWDSQRQCEAADAIATLQAELELYKAECSELRANGFENAQDLWTSYVGLKAELDQWRKDAERYRWLRDKAEFATPHDPFVAEYQCSNDECPGLYRDDLDAAIDKAMESV